MYKQQTDPDKAKSNHKEVSKICFKKMIFGQFCLNTLYFKGLIFIVCITIVTLILIATI